MLKSREENMKSVMKRVKANDPAAMSVMARERYEDGNYDSAVEYYTKAAALGDVEAHHVLGYMYGLGQGVDKDEEKEVYHYEQATIGGHPYARHNLACYEERNGNMERAVKHHIIAANLGYEISMKMLWRHYSAGNISKEQLEATLRAHKAAIDEMKSPERETAYKMRK
jgi:TPR repeat protein